MSSSGSGVQIATAPVQDLRKLLEVDHSKVLVLQGVQEPGNVGTLIRTAAALGWSAVCLADDCTDPFSDKAMRAARGASLRVRCLSHARVDTLFVCLCASLWLRIKHMLKAHVVQVQLAIAPWPEIADFARRQRLHMLAAAPPLRDVSAQERGDSAPLGVNAALEHLQRSRVALVMGSEGQGVSAQVLADCSRIGIPMSGGVESLNVASAGAVYMAMLSDALVSTVHDMHGALRARGE